MSEIPLSTLRDALPDTAKMVSNKTSSGWDTATVWSDEPVAFPDGIDIERQYQASGDAPAVQSDSYDVTGWMKYEVVVN